jgi:hypothetical protein
MSLTSEGGNLGGSVVKAAADPVLDTLSYLKLSIWGQKIGKSMNQFNTKWNFCSLQHYGEFIFKVIKTMLCLTQGHC